MKHTWSPESAFLCLEDQGAKLDRADKTGAWVIRVPARLTLMGCSAFSYLTRTYGLSFKGQNYVDKRGVIHGTLSHASKVLSLVNARRIEKEKYRHGL